MAIVGRFSPVGQDVPLEEFGERFLDEAAKGEPFIVIAHVGTCLA